MSNRKVKTKRENVSAENCYQKLKIVIFVTAYILKTLSTEVSCLCSLGAVSLNKFCCHGLAKIFCCVCCLDLNKSPPDTNAQLKNRRTKKAQKSNSDRQADVGFGSSLANKT